MSSNWKNIGRNSGNMVNHRNVKADKINYEDGKWKSIYDSSGNKKITHQCLNNVNNQNVVVGIGATEPFSRLSLGTNTGDGVLSSEIVGKLAAIALHEDSEGKDFHGLTYVTNVTARESNPPTTNALALFANNSSTELNLSIVNTLKSLY